MYPPGIYTTGDDNDGALDGRFPCLQHLVRWDEASSYRRKAIPPFARFARFAAHCHLVSRTTTQLARTSVVLTAGKVIVRLAGRRY